MSLLCFPLISSSLLDVRAAVPAPVLPGLGEDGTWYPSGSAGSAGGTGHKGGSGSPRATQSHFWAFSCKNKHAVKWYNVWGFHFEQLDLIPFSSSSSRPTCFQKLDALWRDARWIMDCLQCVRSKQWVGAVPLSLVMGGEPPTRPDGEEDESSLTARLTWPHRIQSHRQPTAGKDEPG